MNLVEFKPSTVYRVFLFDHPEWSVDISFVDETIEKANIGQLIQVRQVTVAFRKKVKEAEIKTGQALRNVNFKDLEIIPLSNL